MKVLIIEDDKDINNLMKEELENYGIDAIVAKTGVAAYKILYKTKEEKEFDYIIVDIRLPDENGVEIIKLIRQVFKSKVIVYTAFDDYKDRCEWDYFIEKGLGIEPVTSIIINDFLSKYS